MTEATAETTIDYPKYLEKAPTALQERFAGWLQSEAVGYDPSKAKSKVEAFEEGVRLAVALRIPFQASDFNREANAASQAENAKKRAAAKEVKEKAATEAPAPAEEAKPAKKAAAKKAAPAPAAAPKAARPAARRAPARKPAPAASAPATAEDAPF
jgi:hypothetical protein